MSRRLRSGRGSNLLRDNSNGWDDQARNKHFADRMSTMNSPNITHYRSIDPYLHLNYSLKCALQTFRHRYQDDQISILCRGQPLASIFTEEKLGSKSKDLRCAHDCLALALSNRVKILDSIQNILQSCQK